MAKGGGEEGKRVRVSAQELERVTLKGYAPAVMQRLGSTDDLGRIELLVLVRWKRSVQVRDEGRDRQCVRGGVGRAEEIYDRVVCEI
jgi:hypothetical protein